MASEGILFENYYNSFPNTTTDSEYALLQGLRPDSARSKATSSLFASREAICPLPWAIFSQSSGRLVATRFSVSSDLLNQAYDNFVFGKGEITVGHQAWNS